MKMLRMTVMGVALLGWSGGDLSGGQIMHPSTQNQQPTMPGGGPMSGAHGLGAEPLPPRIEEQQAKARNSERQKKLVADTDKLLALATDLKAQVDKTNKDVLSVDVIKKADEIEKLAHSVKERMKD
jgi:hypothetical protein